jgi:hypothetical protein
MARQPFVAVPLLLCLLPTIAVAETPAETASSGNPEQSRPRAGSFSIAALAGYNYGDEVGADGYRLMFGYGGRVGYSFETTPLYLGATVVGYEDRVEYDDTTEVGTENYIDVAIDIGGEIVVAPVILRPYVGVGVQLAIYESPSGGNSAIFPHVSPGLLARYPLGPLDFGVDARWELGGSKAVSALGSVGVAF